MSKEIMSPEQSQRDIQQTIIVNVEKKRSNPLGTMGFVFAVFAIVFSWVPAVDFIIWFLGALFSFIGLFKSPRGLAITGFLLSFIGIIIIVALIGSFAAVVSAL